MAEKQPYETIVKAVLVAVLYLAFGKLAFALSVTTGIVTNVPFFSEGIGLGFTLVFGPVMALGIAIGQFVLAITSGLGLFPSIAISLLNAILALLGRHIFIRQRLSGDFSRVKDILSLSLIIVFILQPISAIVGNLVLLKQGNLQQNEFLFSVLSWWFGNSIGQLVLTPLILYVFQIKNNERFFRWIYVPPIVLTFLFVFGLFSLTNYVAVDFKFPLLLLLFPVSLAYSSLAKPFPVFLLLFTITIASFSAVSTGAAGLLEGEKVHQFMQLDLMLISLLISNLILSVLISNLKSTRAKLRVSEERFRKLSDVTFEGIIIHDNGVAIDANEALKQMFGYKTEEVIGKNIIDLVILPEYHQDIQENIKRDVARPYEVIARRKDGTLIPVEIEAKNLIYDDKQFRVAAVRDITERKKAEAIIQQQNQKLQKLNADKDKFIQILAHDLRNPFGAIIGFLELLLSDINKLTTNELKERLELIHGTTAKTYNLLEELLLWSKSQAGKMPFKPQKTEVYAVCCEVIIMAKSQIEEKELKISCLSEKQVFINADINMFKTIVRNLVSNAIKFTPRQGTISITSKSIENKVEISVTDSGVGIGPENLHKLWDITRQHTTKGTAGETGTGLGLLLCKEFVNRHEGDIWVESTEGLGSTFRFTMPLFV